MPSSPCDARAPRAVSAPATEAISASTKQHDGRRAGEAGRAVERLQQHDRIRPREKARDQVGELEFADRQRRDHDQSGREAVAQRRHHDVEEARAKPAPSDSAARSSSASRRCRMSPTSVCIR